MISRFLPVLAALTLYLSSAVVASAAQANPAIALPADAAPNVKLAARELRRYVYLRTGKLLPIVSGKGAISLRIDPSLQAQEYRLKGDGKTLSIAGGSEVAVLYGAYAFAEKLGVRFYLHGDTVPDERLAFSLPVLDETCKPFFETRGIQPFHDFPEGPDWWNRDDYLAYLGQLARMRMNFLGLHCYPEGNVGPECLVWIGTPEELNSDGSVKNSYPAYWQNTGLSNGFNYAAMKTSEFSGGARLLFAADDYGPDVMAGCLPLPKTPGECNRVFDNVGRQMSVVMAEARRLGIRTCIGTETPLTIPTPVRERLKARGLNPDDPVTRRALYTGMFQRIAQLYPVDYYWLWTPENWTWGGNNAGEFTATRDDIQLALDALKSLGNPFTLATCGWVLGPQNDRAALDAFLPASSPMSCINRNVGHDGVEPAFANITGRPKWAIPWMENDPNLVGPQPWAARMRYDAVDARRFGCTGLLGIHWRTRALAPNVAALAAAAWDQSWVPAGFDTRLVPPAKAQDGALGGNGAGFTAPVAGTTNPAIYQTVRYDVNGYRLQVPNGAYTVTLQFNEPFYTAAGKRVFGAKLQGTQVFTNLDMFARAGQNQAIDLSYPGINVTNGVLQIDFTREVEFPCIAGIVVNGTTAAVNQTPGQAFMRKINCGGPALGEYEADMAGSGGTLAAPANRAMPVEDFYIDFARANFGGNVGEAAGRILARIDGVNLPQISNWKTGPGDLLPNGAPWSEVRKQYAFVDELAALRPQITRAGDRDRFDYWLNTYRGMAAMAESSCLRGALDRAMAEKKFAEALKLRLELAQAWARLLSLQTSIVNTPGELGTIANLERHVRRHAQFVEAHDVALAQGLGAPLPAEARPSLAYAGSPRIIVPTVRSIVRSGETLKVRVIVLDNEPPRQAVLRVRALGQGRWRETKLTRVGRAVYAAELPGIREDMEYSIAAETLSGEKLVWPASAPDLNQTVVVED